MKIQRINRIRDYRLFKDFTWQAGVPDFAQFNLIYGWNATGKTTLSTLFRHLERGEPVSEGEVEFLIDGSVIKGKAITDSAPREIRVFNRDTLDRSVFEEPDKQLPAIYYFGEDSAQKQRRVLALKKDLTDAVAEREGWERARQSAGLDLESLCTDRAREIKNLLTTPGGGPYNNYDSRNFKQKVKLLLAAKPPSAPLTDELRMDYLATKGGVPLAKLSPLGVAYPSFAALADRVEQLLGKSVSSRVLKEIATDPPVASWVSRGLSLHTGERASATCHFCGQQIPPSRIEALNGHFNDEFALFQAEVEALIADIDGAKLTLENIQPPNKGLLYPHLAKEFEHHVVVLKQQVSEAVSYVNGLNRVLQSKKEKPFEAVEAPSFLRVGVPPEKSEIRNINSLISEHNNHTDNFGTKVSHARNELERDLVLRSLPKYTQQQEAIQKADKGIEEAISKEKRLRREIAELESHIRQHQRPAAELNREVAAYLGSKELLFEVRESGYAISRDGKPAMHLSEGERTAIAFMYFLKSLEDTDFGLDAGVVVVDDPVSSLDANSLYSAFSFLKNRTASAGQLFVLTHNFTLFRQVKNWFHYLNRGKGKDEAKRPAHFYMLTTTWNEGHRGATLCRLDPLLHEYESEYQYLFKRVYDEANKQTVPGSAESFYDLPNIARRLLEAFLAFKLPEHPSDRLFRKMEELNFESVKKTRLLRFLHTYSHAGQVAEPEHDISILSETPAALRDLLELIRELDPGHYAGMENRVRPESGGEEVVSTNI